MAGRSDQDASLPSTSNGPSLEAWYPNTAPSPPTRLLLPTSGLTWKPFRVLKTTLHEPPLQGGSRPGSPGILPAHPPCHGSLRYHSGIGWHYRYCKPFKIIGKPYPQSLVKPCAIPSQSPAVPAGLGARGSGPWRWEPENVGSQVEGQAQGSRIKDREALNFSCQVRLSRADRPSGFYRSLPLPWVRLQRIEQRPGFGCLLEPLKTMRLHKRLYRPGFLPLLDMLGRPELVASCD